jgi:hypothetical protein
MVREEMNHYKSWSGLNKWLNECLCEELKGRITYFLTRYHKVHDSYGRAAILLDGKELVCFSWIEQYKKEQQVFEKRAEDRSRDWLGIYDELRPVWNETCTLCEWDFLSAVLEYRNLSIQDALNSEDYIIKTFAILDKRVGKRTLQRIKEAEEYKKYPEWVRQFYELRLNENAK